MSRKPLQAQRVTLTATATAMVTQQQRQNQQQRPSAGTRHKATDTMSTTAWTHTDTFGHTRTQTHSSGNTHARTLEHTRTPVKPRLGAETFTSVCTVPPVMSEAFTFFHTGSKSKKTRFLSFSGPNQNPNNKVLDISRTKLPAVIMSFAKPPAAVGTIMTSGHDKQVPARLPPLITAKESTGIIHLLVELA